MADKNPKNGSDREREARDALIRATAWQIAKDRGYSNAAFALAEAIRVVEDQERKQR